MIALTLGLAWTLALVLGVLDGRRSATRALSLFGMLAVLVSVGFLALDVLAGAPVIEITGNWPKGVGIQLRADALGVAFALVTTAMLVAALASEIAAGQTSRTFPALVAFLAVGLNGLFLTGDVFNFYVFFEISVAAAIVLTATGGKRRQYRGAFTFAVVNLVGSVLFLAGTAALYHISGTLDMEEIRAAIHTRTSGSALTIAAVFFAAFGVKLGLFPFHFWVPSVYRDATPTVAAMLSGAIANIGSYGLIRFGGELLTGGRETGATAAIAIGLTSVLYGGTLAISRRSTAEVLAYSSIAQAGYVLVAIGIGGPAGFLAAIVYALVNAVDKTLLFLSVGQRGPLVAAAFAIGAASVAGLPPTAGFFGKVALFRASATAGDAATLALIAVGSLLSIVFMSRTYQQRYWRPSDTGPAVPLAGRLVSVSLALLLLWQGLSPQWLLWLGARAAAALG